MKKINVYGIESLLMSDKSLDATIERVLEELSFLTDYKFNLVPLKDLYKTPLSLILVKTGGSEELFLKSLPSLKEPFYLLTHRNNNSLAASLEILSYLNAKGLKGEILHGNNSDIAKRILTLLKESK